MIVSQINENSRTQVWKALFLIVNHVISYQRKCKQC